MDQSTAFYQALTTASFTLLGIWVAVMQTAHGGWRSDPARHATTLHITLKFFLPGVLGLVSRLGSTTGGGLVWRVAFVVGGFAGFIESVRYLARHRTAHRDPPARGGRSRALPARPDHGTPAGGHAGRHTAAGRRP